MYKDIKNKQDLILTGSQCCVNQGSSNSVLEGPAEFSSNPDQTHSHVNSQWPWRLWLAYSGLETDLRKPCEKNKYDIIHSFFFNLNNISYTETLTDDGSANQINQWSKFEFFVLRTSFCSTLVKAANGHKHHWRTYWAQALNKTACTILPKHSSPSDTLANSTNMSFLSGVLGNKAAGSFVDQAVDKAGEFLMFKNLKENISALYFFMSRHSINSQ